MTERIVVGAYLALFFAVLAFFVRKVGAATGRSPIVRHSPAEYPLMAFVERAVFTAYSVLALSVLFYVFDRTPPVFFDQFAFPLKDRLSTAGVFLAGLSLALIFTAQFQMRDSWRMGIDDKHDTEMVGGGLFRVFRHPIYLFAIVGSFSLFLIFPHAASLASFVAIYTGLSVQARIEEEFLLRRWGEKYKNFMMTRRRWF